MGEISLNPEKTVLIIAGPTASGKSKLALDIGSKYDGVIINCVSMQIYRELHLITARPSHSDEAKLPHKLYGIMSVTERCSVGIWYDLAIEEIEKCWKNGKLPIVTGGTGLYIKTLMEGISSIPIIPKEVRDKVIARRDEIGEEAFYRELQGFDQKTAEKIHSTDSQRMIRAYEVYLATNRSLSDWHKSSPMPPRLEARYQVVTLYPSRDRLYASCESRLDWMVENGALDEVRCLMKLDLNPNLPAMKALGVLDFMAYLQDKTSLVEALDLAKKATRHYAKRQMTWFRNQIIPDIKINSQYSERNKVEIFSKIIN